MLFFRQLRTWLWAVNTLCWLMWMFIHQYTQSLSLQGFLPSIHPPVPMEMGDCTDPGEQPCTWSCYTPWGSHGSTQCHLVMDGIPSIKPVNYTTQHGVIHKLAEVPLNSFMPLIKVSKCICPSHYWFSHGYWTVDCSSLEVASQPMSYLLQSTFIRSFSFQFRNKSTVWDPVKGFAESREITVALPLSTDAVTPS